MTYGSACSRELSGSIQFGASGQNPFDGVKIGVALGTLTNRSSPSERPVIRSI